MPCRSFRRRCDVRGRRNLVAHALRCGYLPRYVAQIPHPREIDTTRAKQLALQPLVRCWGFIGHLPMIAGVLANQLFCVYPRTAKLVCMLVVEAAPATRGQCSQWIALGDLGSGSASPARSPCQFWLDLAATGPFGLESRERWARIPVCAAPADSLIRHRQRLVGFASVAAQRVPAPVFEAHWLFALSFSLIDPSKCRHESSQARHTQSD